MRLIAGLVCLVLGLLGCALLIGLATDQGSSTASDRVFVGILAGIFVATGALLVYLDWREHGRRPDLFAIVAGVLPGMGVHRLVRRWLTRRRA